MFLRRFMLALPFAVMVVSIFVYAALYHNFDNRIIDATTSAPLHSGWTITVDGNTSSMLSSLPDSVDAKGTGQVIISRTISSINSSTDSIVFFTSLQSVEAHIGSTIVYEFEPPGFFPSRTPGNAWNFVPVSLEDTGQTLAITLTSNYDKDLVTIPDFYIGTASALALNTIYDQGPSLIISLIMLFVGLGAAVFWLFDRKKSNGGNTTIALAFFAMSIGIWSLVETQIPPLFFGMPLLFTLLSYITIKLIAISLTYFFINLYGLKDNKILEWLLRILILDFWVTLVLQISGLLDYHQTNLVGRLLVLVGSIYLTVIVVMSFIRSAREKKISKKIMAIHIICLVSICFFNVMNVIYTFLPNHVDNASFFRVGMLIYFIGLAYISLNKTMALVKEGMKAQDIKKEARTDSLTKLNNRSACDEDIQMIPDSALKTHGIVMCDLNNLKLYNDLYGHEHGDNYIITCAALIHEAFKKYGTTYRIGGDEFVVIVKDLEESTALQIQNDLHEKTELESNKPENKDLGLHMAIATGYAKFDPALDKTLHDTRTRADQVMYKVKQEMKHHSDSGRIDDVGINVDSAASQEGTKGIERGSLGYMEVIEALKQILDTIRDGHKPKPVGHLVDYAPEYGEILGMVNGVISALQEQDEYMLSKFVLAMNAAQVGLWDMLVVKGDPVNPLNKFTWSDEFRHMLGYHDENDFPNLTASWSDKLHPEDKERTLKAFADHLNDRTGKTPYDLSYRLLKADGNYSYYRAYGSTIRDNEGYALRVAGALQDISEQKKMELEKVKLDLAVKAARVGLWDMEVVKEDPVNPNNNFVWSDDFRHMLGYQNENDFPNLTSSWSDKLHPDDQERTLQAFAAHILDKTGKTPYDVTYRLLKKDGEYSYFRAYGSTMRDEQGNPLRVAGALQNIDYEKQVEIEKETYDMRLRLLQKSINVALWDMVVDPDDPVNGNNDFYWSPEFRHMLGFKDETDFPNVTSSWSDKLHPEDKEKTLQAFAAHILDKTGKTPYNVKYRLKRATGEYVWYRADGATLRSTDGTPLRVVGSLEEIEAPTAGVG